MRVLLVCLGTTGDLLPFLGLADALAQRGDEVDVLTHAGLGEHVSRADAGRGLIRHLPLPPDPWPELGPGLARRIRHDGLRGLRGLRDLFAPWVPAMAAAVDAAVPGHDVVLASTLGWVAHHSALGHGVPSVELPLQPMHPSRDWPPVLLTTRTLGPWLNREMGQQVQQAMWRLWLGAANEIRAGHGLPGVTASQWWEQREAQGLPVWHPISPAVVPRPADWRPGVEVTGYLWPPAQGEVPAQVEDFLAAGPPPVLVSLGSTMLERPEEVAREIVTAGRAAGVRLLVQSGWAGLQAAGDDVLATGHLDHTRVMPRTLGVVHHSGAGTTAAALRAGVPGVPSPGGIDQPFWAQRTRAIGAATPALRPSELRAGPLAERLRRLSDPGLRAGAVEAGRAIRAEDGAGRLLALLTAHLGG